MLTSENDCRSDDEQRKKVSRTFSTREGQREIFVGSNGVKESLAAERLGRLGVSPPRERVQVARGVRVGHEGTAGVGLRQRPADLLDLPRVDIDILGDRRRPATEGLERLVLSARRSSLTSSSLLKRTVIVVASDMIVQPML